jgi:hypothetical protein
MMYANLLVADEQAFHEGALTQVLGDGTASGAGGLQAQRDEVQHGHQ